METHRLPYTVVALIAGAARRANLDSAAFSSDVARDKEIKDAIRLWLQTWIQGPLEEVLAYDRGERTAAQLAGTVGSVS